jgi:hypothetical protein
VIAVLCNLEEIDPAKLAQGVADIYLADVFSTPAADGASATLPQVSLSAEQLASKAGFVSRSIYREIWTVIRSRWQAHVGAGRRYRTER